MRATAVALALSLALAGCGAAPEGRGAAPARGLTADGGGLQPNGTPLRIDFGRHETGAVAAVSGLLGAGPVETGVNRDCGAGPLGHARWANGFSMSFRRQSFVGWTSAPGRGAPVATPSGLAPGAPAAALAGAAVTGTSLGSEFRSAGVSGLVEAGKIGTIWAGTTCVFR